MAKIVHDKYYTPRDLAKRLIDKTYEVIGEENISETIEPSAGDGAFSEQIYRNVCFAYDIEPEAEGIIKQDFLKLDIPYLHGRLVIGNPPFGRCMNLAQKFYKKSVSIADYIAFVLPISQLNNQRSLYEFDLVYSEDLGNVIYSDRKLHCCFNIYKRPPSGEINKSHVKKLKDITIVRQDSKKYKDVDFDIRMCYWGDGSAGKILGGDENYSAEYKIKINNDELKHEVVEILKKADWHKILNSVAMLKIQQFHILEYLKEQIPELE